MSQPVELQCTVKGDGPAVVLLHGLYGSGQNWGRHVRWLAEHYRVLTPDLRNHGRSPHARPMDYPAMAADLAALLDAQGIEKASWVGHSMGGKAAMALALTAPERVERLLVADIAPVTYPWGQDEVLEAMRAVELDNVATRQDADEQLAGDIPQAMIRQFLLTNLERRDDRYAWRIPLDLLAEAMPTISAFPEFTTTYEGPSLFLHGGASDYVTPDHAGTIRAYFPNAELRAVAGAGHWLHVETPEAFAEALGQFLE